MIVMLFLKKDLKEFLGNQIYSKNDGEILETATSINAKLVLIGILSFIACFAFSLGLNVGLVIRNVSS